MCGIVAIHNMVNAQGVTFSESEKAFLTKYLLSELTMETESRGKDATGYFSLFRDGNGIGLKHNLRASLFCTKEDWKDKKFVFRNHLKLLETYHNEKSPIASVIAHCRAKTVGSETDNNNNHPIYVNNLVGIHNGCLSNHSEIYNSIKDNITRVGSVDSEMIVQLLMLETENGNKKFDNSMVETITEKLDGSYAFICVDKKDPNSVFYLRDTRPIEFIYLREAGLLIAVSEKKFFYTAMAKYKWFNFYDINVPKEITSETFTVPNESGFVLKLDTEITPQVKINDLFTIVKTKPASANWKKEAYKYKYDYDNRSYGNNYNNPNKNGGDTNKTGSGIPSCYSNTYKPKPSNEPVNKPVNEPVNEPVKPVNEETTPINENPDCPNISTVIWNKKKKKFNYTSESKSSIYIKQKETKKHYVLFRNVKKLAKKLNVEEYVVTSFTEVQLANRISRHVYDKYTKPLMEENEKLKKEIGKLKAKDEKLKVKSQKARSYIIALRQACNVLVKMLHVTYQPNQVKLTSQETNSLKNMWRFMYANKKEEIRNSTLGKFLISLNEKMHKQQTIASYEDK